MEATAGATDDVRRDRMGCGAQGGLQLICHLLFVIRHLSLALTPVVGRIEERSDDAPAEPIAQFASTEIAGTALRLVRPTSQ